jgi:tRNA(Leu) C34 or U34 (ribose-2'-O)-methylase TrmL
MLGSGSRRSPDAGAAAVVPRLDRLPDAVEERGGRCHFSKCMNINVVLVEPEIHWNTGNAGRTCLAAGAQLHLVEPLGFSLDEREVRRAGLDYWPRVKPRLWPSLDALERALPELGEAFLVSPDAPRDFWEVGYPERTVLLFARRASASRPKSGLGMPIASSGFPCGIPPCAPSTSRPAWAFLSTRWCASGKVASSVRTG